jgi:hypothetical protein
VAEIVNLKKQDKDFDKRIEDWELEGAIHEQFLKRQDLMHKASIMDERITRIDAWLLQYKLPMEMLIAIWSRATYVEWFSYNYHELSPEQKHLMLLNLRECFKEFEKLPQRWQEALWSGYSRWHSTFLFEEEKAKANG